MRHHESTPPGVRWILILGVAGFAAGFFRPMLLAPSSNIGPLVGIIMTGPAGAALGALLWAICALFRSEARTQWRLLYTITTIGVLGILLSIRPERLGVEQTQMLATVFDGITRHSPEGLWFKRYAEQFGFAAAVEWRDSGRPIPEPGPGNTGSEFMTPPEKRARAKRVQEEAGVRT